MHTRGSLIRWMEDMAVEYRRDAAKSINRNSHMNELNGRCLLIQDEVDALLTDFINYCAGKQGIDYGLHTSDLKGD